MYKLRVDESEPCELCLVDVGDDQLVWRCELGLGASEELVEVLRCFATLWTGEKEKEEKFRQNMSEIIRRVQADGTD